MNALTNNALFHENLEKRKFELEKDINDILIDLNQLSQGNLSCKDKIDRDDAIGQIIDALNRSIISIATSLRKVDDSAQQNIKKAKDGADIMKQAKDTTQEVVGFAKDMQSSVSNLLKVKEEISNIISVINAIAEQTNLLALNASIEAARAGEHGRGFAVVADEVRLLASKTVSATKEIEQLIYRLNDETEKSVNHVERVNTRLIDSDRLTMQANETLSNIVKSSTNIEDALSVFKGY